MKGRIVLVPRRHTPLAAKDFVHRYDEYFDKRMAR